MKYGQYLWLIGLFFAASCGVTRQNAETIYFLDVSFYRDSTGFKSHKYCFDDVRGEGRPSYSSFCADSGGALSLPLCISQDTSVFYFTKGKRVDTLGVKYALTFGDDGFKYVPYINKLHITKCTFDSVYVPCKSDSVTLCDGKIYTIYVFN